MPRRDDDEGEAAGPEMFTVNGTIKEALSIFRGVPMLLALLLLNAGIGGMLTYLLIRSSEVRSQERTEILRVLERCMTHGELDGSGQPADGKARRAEREFKPD